MVAALHELSGAGPDTEFGALQAQLIASPASRRPGPVLWVVDRSPPFAPGLAAYGLCPTRIIFADAGKAVLGMMEDSLRHGGLAAVVGEVSGWFNPRTSEPEGRGRQDCPLQSQPVSQKGRMTMDSVIQPMPPYTGLYAAPMPSLASPPGRVTSGYEAACCSKHGPARSRQFQPRANQGYRVCILPNWARRRAMPC